MLTANWASPYGTITSITGYQTYKYTTYLEFGLEQFTEEAKKEKYYADLKGQIDQINKRIEDSKRNELMLYKDQIKMLLEEVIVSHQYLEKGKIETRFKYDEELKKAIEVVHNTTQYKKVLNIE